jgi:hypothetical protein
MRFACIFVLVFVAFQSQIDAVDISSTSFPSYLTVVNPQTDSDMPLAMSFLYCQWGKDSFTKCPTKTTAWNGVANFDYAKATVTGNVLIIPYITSYHKNPMCFVSSEVQSAHFYSINPENDFVKLYLFNRDGSHGTWENMWFEIGCFGVMDKVPLVKG